MGSAAQQDGRSGAKQSIAAWSGDCASSMRAAFAYYTRVN
jgi:hypothetical protein